MYNYQYIIPKTNNMLRNKKYSNSFNNSYPINSYYVNPNDERFFWAPFVVGGLAGTALGFGIANNNQLNNGNNQYPIYGPVYPVYQPYPIFPSYNNYYY